MLEDQPGTEVSMTRDQALELFQSTKWQRDQIAQDLEAALNMCRQYQRMVSMLGVNDPNWVECRNLLTKYHMPFEHHTNAPGKIFAGEKDITLHPDSIEGATVEAEELPAGDDGQIPGQTNIYQLTDGRGGYIIDDDDGDPC